MKKKSLSPPMDKPFLMKCVMCGATKQYEPGGPPTDWRVLVLAGGRFFCACPAEFPADGADTDAFKAAYLKVLRKVIKLTGTMPTKLI